MSANWESQLKSPPPSYVPTREFSPDVRRRPSSRIPTKSSGSASESKSKATQHVSQLAKRTSRSVAPAEKGERKISAGRAPPVSETSARHPASLPRKESAIPAPDGPSRGSHAASNSRHLSLQPPPTIRTPSLVSGSSASTFDSPRSMGLRRKPSSIDRYAAQQKARTEPVGIERSTLQSRHGQRYTEEPDDSVFGISMPSTSNPTNLGVLPDPEREWQATPPIVNYAQSATPSTRYTDSPFSHVPTPSSASSYSPAVYSTTGSTPKPLQQSPVQSRLDGPKQDRGKSDGSRLRLPAVRETSSTSSSNSTVKASNPNAAPPRRKEIPRNVSSAPPVSKAPGASSNTSRPQTASRPSQPEAPGRSLPLIPPELAHLNVDPPDTDKPLPPLRPSRDGAGSISDMRRPSPVVQSDLPKLYTTYHKRTPSQETPVSPPAPSPSLRSRFGLSPKSSSKQASPRVDSAISPPPSAHHFARGPTPDNFSTESARPLRTDSPAVGPAPSPSKSPRFRFLSRKSKGDNGSSKVTEKPKRQHIKGPAAGTGHEGYRRFGFRGRSGSNTSSNGFRSPSADSSTSSAPGPSAGRKGSLTSSKDGSELDDFLRERLAPKILRGSGSTFGAPASTSESQPATQQYPSSSSSLDSYPKPQLLPSAMQSERSHSPFKRPPMERRMPSDSSEDDVHARFPTSAARRSLQHTSQRNEDSTATTPDQIYTAEPRQLQTKDGPDPYFSASAVPEEARFGKEGLWLRPQQAHAKTKPTEKGSFLQRAQAAPSSVGRKSPVPSNAAIAPDPRSHGMRSVPHYAMMGPLNPIDLSEVEQIVEEGDTSMDDTVSEEMPISTVVPYVRRHSGLLPSPPLGQSVQASSGKSKPAPPRLMVRQDSSESPELLRAQTATARSTPHMVDIPRSPARSPEPPRDTDSQQHAMQKNQQALSTPEMPQEGFAHASNADWNVSARQPRLSPIGRIPQVVSRRDRDRKLPETSFSRPFVRGQPHPNVKPPGALYNQIRASRELTSPVDGGSQPVSTTSTRSDGLPGTATSSSNTNTSTASTNRTSMDIMAGSQLFYFPRKGSEVSNSSGSGTASWIAAATAQPLQQDDPWAEYNDLLDDMMPQKTPISAGSSQGAPFQYAHMLHDSAHTSVPRPLNVTSSTVSSSLAPHAHSDRASAVLSVPEQVMRFMQPSLSPLRPHSTISDLVNQYGSGTTSGSRSPYRTSLPPPARSSAISHPSRASLPNARASMSSSRNSHASSHSRSASLPDTKPHDSQTSLRASVRFNKDAQLLNIAEHEESEQASDANLRLAALMTSKWLSFGRVLFSPAHHEMRLSDQPRILVLDGLGSDWSYWVALTYPTANVYSLGPPSSAAASWPGMSQTPPPNLRLMSHSSISTAFPFPKGFFTCVVFRFPVGTSDAAYHACIFECKRVLRPGGHLEVATLDLDLMNMGARARTVVRGLKTRMQAHDPDISLRNLSDSLVRLIGRRGFEEVQRCVVGVPAAGRIPRSQDISSCSSDNSAYHSGALPRKRRSSVKELNFADLLGDARDSQPESNRGSDEGITKMVAKVGRWWYESCYERPLLGSDKSIWADHRLLRECEKQGTSFRMLICYAQKPTQPRRRTVSV